MSVIDKIKDQIRRGAVHQGVAVVLARQPTLGNNINVADIQAQYPGNSDYVPSAVKHFMETGLGRYYKRKGGLSTASFFDPDQALTQIRAALNQLSIAFDIKESGTTKEPEDVQFDDERHSELDAYDQARIAAAKALGVRPERLHIQFLP
ncbi:MULTISPECIES: hypothetical protein [unclassified Mesorhizobium]|uniref:hypothetical protein n=1 Tax=unclassified Mesorhizobium TaxID=325217 RepID=UPI001129465D|nr:MULTISPECIES: hypothetical protein [unclassified Mesorhizobium]TPK95308.1 hypothetical protein FJ567_23150 [Mesorhizobium sp. B2-4-16]TPL61003.1 hypothetical protein FJ956_26400 [Mesorhizobium sp. B2-4-3]